MPSSEQVVWGIHGGRTGDADYLFLQKKRIALGWAKMGNLSELTPNRDAFKTRMADCFPESKPGAIPVNAGQLFRFVYEMQIGDLVVYPSQRDSQIYIGQVTGDYQYNSTVESSYPHQRSVKWIHPLSRTHFTQGALYEIGSAMSFFQVKSYAEEFIAAWEGKAAAEPISVTKDESAQVVAEQIEQTTRDFIKKQLAAKFKGHPLSHFVAHLLNTMGYETQVSPPGSDGGIDIYAYKDKLRLSPMVKVQVKSGDETVGSPTVQQLSGSVEPNEFGLFVTLGSYSKAALDFATRKSNLRLIDGQQLIELILEHYEDFSPLYKEQLPLRNVYIPKVLLGDEE